MDSPSRSIICDCAATARSIFARLTPLDRIAGPFDSASHARLRSVASDRSFGAFNADNVAVYVWRLPVFSVTRAIAYCQEEAGDHCYTFSILGNDSPLFTLPVSDPAPEDIAGELNLPVRFAAAPWSGAWSWGVERLDFGKLLRRRQEHYCLGRRRRCRAHCGFEDHSS